ncbi:MAG: 2Fe-2S iron-sulfur cluster binding domain-containing protein, partial [Betaproteobacteria bacterium]|nr:2Fe-2S iron-sulfur cluster binding domain-containing protein [Betaproteobacteria bacterium]
AKKTNLSLMVDGKTHELTIDRGSLVLDSALDAGLDVPFSCKAGVCSTCRCLVMAGTVAMDKNFTLDQDEIDRGYVLSCQARATSEAVTLDFDQR